MPATTDTAAWVAQRIREARKRRNWSQEELAERLNLTQTAISYWESAKRTPGLDDLIELAGVLERDVSFFLPRAEPRAPIRALLRATAERLESANLDEVLQGLVDELESGDVPLRELNVAATRPVRAAKELLAKANISAPPVPVDDLARRCGARLVSRRFDDALSGLLIEVDGRALIAVNNLQSHVRQRFTIGHELGHLLLGHHDRFHIDLGPNAEHGTPPGYDWRSERAANDFAAELLMPTPMVHDAFTHQPSVTALAELFRVSELAMGYRLANLHLR
jgi:transcriptional regulator with XRE-family HTH domain